MVDATVNPQDIVANRIPPGSELLPAPEEQLGKLAVRTRVLVTGGNLTNASMGTDQNGGNAIEFRFDGPGTKAFGEEPEGTLLSSEEVARQSLDVLLANQTGHIIDIRRAEGPAALVEP
jgi:preprotein translocase subunit SecD